MRVSDGRGLVGAALCLMLGACQPDDAGETAGPDLVDMQADQVIIGMDYTITSDGLRRGRLLADTAFYYDGEAQIQLRKVNATFYDADGGEVSRLESESGVFYTETEDMQATGHVVVIDLQEDQRLETESLFFSAQADIISTDDDFVLRQGNTTFEGKGFSSDPSMNRTRMNQPSGVSQGIRQPIAGAPVTVPAGGDTSTVSPDSLPESAVIPGDSTVAAADPGVGVPPDTSSVPADTGQTVQDTLPASANRTGGVPRPAPD